MKAERKRILKSTEILLWVYGVGLAGMLLPFTRELFKIITPLNLLFATAFLFWGKCHARRVLITGAFIAVASFFIEAAGVNTGQVFGVYSYGKTLGPALLNTPIIIGLNWFLLIYCTNVISRQIWDLISARSASGSAGPLRSASDQAEPQQPVFARSGSLRTAFIIFAGSLLMVMYDLILEPAAVRLDMWQWECGIIPLRNYLGWFFFSVIFHTVIKMWGEEEMNPRALPLFAVQLVFFAIIDVFGALAGRLP